MKKFYLISTEIREPYAPHCCELIKRIGNEIRNDLALVKIIPSIPNHIYNTSEDIDRLIIGSRNNKMSLFSIFKTFPISVYICRLKNDNALIKDIISSDDFTILDWGEVYKDEKIALQEVEKMKNKK